MLMKARETNQIAGATALLRRLCSQIRFGALVAITFAFHTLEAVGQQLPATNSAPLTRGAKYVGGELLVKLVGGEAKAQIAISTHGIVGATVLHSFSAIGWEHVRLP